MVDTKTGIARQGRPATAAWLIYDLVASKMPTDKVYTMWVWVVGEAPRAATSGLSIDESGNVVCSAQNQKLVALGDVPPCDPSQKFELALDAAKAEPKRVALISIDQQVKAFAKVTPFPIEASHGPCHLKLEMLAPLGKAFRIIGDGFSPGAEVAVVSTSEQETVRASMRVKPDGTTSSTVFPAVVGKASGTATWTEIAQSCRVSLTCEWGAEATKLQ